MTPCVKYTPNTRLAFLGAAIVSTVAVVSCSDSNDNAGAGYGGSNTTNNGGAISTGGANTVGGSMVTGGRSAGGATATGGTTAAGGTTATGGITATGGSISTAGKAAAGTSAAAGAIAGGGASQAAGTAGTTSPNGGSPGIAGSAATAGTAGSGFATFTGLYSAVIRGKCLPCHSTGNGVAIGMLDLGTQQAAFMNLVGSSGNGVAPKGMSAGTSGTTCASLTGALHVHPGSAATSLIWQKMNAKLQATMAPCGNPMPAGAAAVVSQAEVDAVAAWINAGAINN